MLLFMIVAIGCFPTPRLVLLVYFFQLDRQIHYGCYLVAECWVTRESHTNRKFILGPAFFNQVFQHFRSSSVEIAVVFDPLFVLVNAKKWIIYFINCDNMQVQRSMLALLLPNISCNCCARLSLLFTFFLFIFEEKDFLPNNLPPRASDQLGKEMQLLSNVFYMKLAATLPWASGKCQKHFFQILRDQWLKYTCQRVFPPAGGSFQLLC